MIEHTNKSLNEKSLHERFSQHSDDIKKNRPNFIPPIKERPNQSSFEASLARIRSDNSKYETSDLMNSYRTSARVPTWSESPLKTEATMQTSIISTERTIARLKEAKQDYNITLKEFENRKILAKKPVHDMIKFKEVFIAPKQKALKIIRDQDTSLRRVSSNKLITEPEKILTTQGEETDRRKSEMSPKHLLPRQKCLRSQSQADFSDIRNETTPTLRKGSVVTLGEQDESMALTRTFDNKDLHLKTLGDDNTNMVNEVDKIPKERLVFEELIKVQVRNTYHNQASPLEEERGLNLNGTQINGNFKGSLKDFEMKARGKTKLAMIDSSKTININFNIGSLHEENKDFTEAILAFRKFVKGAQKSGDNPGIIVGLNRLGICYYYLKQYSESLEFHYQALTHCGIDDYFACYYNTAILHRKLRNYPQALKNFDKAIYWAKEFHDPESESLAQGQIGIVYLESGNGEAAIENFKSCYEQAIQLKNTKFQLDCLIIISKIARSLGFVKVGKGNDLVNIYQKAYYCAKKLDNKRMAEICLCNMGVVKGTQKFPTYTKNFNFENVPGLYD